MTSTNDASVELVQEADNDSSLHSTLDSGDKEKVESLLRNGADPNITNEQGLTPLHVICNNLGEDDVDLMDLFFRINEELNRPVQLDAQNKEGNSALHLAVIRGNKKAIELLLRRGARSNLANAEGLTPLLLICKIYHDADDDEDDEENDDDNESLAEMFFRINEEKHQLVQVNVQDNQGNTPLILAMDRGDENLMELLLRRGADPNTTDKEGSSPLHVICNRADYGEDDDVGLIKSFFKINQELNRSVLVDVRDEQGRTPLHLALWWGLKRIAKFLLRRGADPNSVDEKGSTPLHNICDSSNTDLLRMFFRINDELNQRVEINVRDNKSGNTPLHEALEWGGKENPRMLLERGADINLTNDQGWSALHVVCMRSEGDDDQVPQMFFEMTEGLQQSVRVNAQDNEGNTPLNFALQRYDKKTAELMLRRGADPNLVNAEGSTALHVICRYYRHADVLTKMLLEICDELNRPVQLDALDKSGRTPLQWAVLNISADAVDVLLDHGADLSKFVFPTADEFCEVLKERHHKHWLISDLELLTNTLEVVERLADRGYVLERSDALTIMDVLKERGLLKKSAGFEGRWCEEDEFVKKGNYVMMNIAGLSFYDSTRCVYEKLARTFCQPWALESFMKLTGCRLPILCCEMIVDYVNNEDLRNICLADTD
ncbi:ankyrin-3-like [Trichogramma pretiosum]|uniref:ankyrin-3-like n=1 Tax=Trichogramma pretiosum TaxID=7493 RepID=UPI000C71C85D|nr:ankyrin-3-like [Trichogramma pretiosum]